LNNKAFNKIIIYLLIYGLLSSDLAFAGQKNAQLSHGYLSPRINLSNESILVAIDVFSKIKIDAAIEKTVANVNELGQRNFKRELSAQELVIALAMISEGKSLHYIDKYFFMRHYVHDHETGRRKKPGQILRIRIVQALSIVCAAAGFLMRDMLLESYLVNIVIFGPLFLVFMWFFTGWSVDFFSWVERMLDPRNKYIFAEPGADLNEEEKEQYLNDIKQIITNNIQQFDKKAPPRYSIVSVNSMSLKSDSGGLSSLAVNFPGLILSSI